MYFNIELDIYSLFIWCRSTTTTWTLVFQYRPKSLKIRRKWDHQRKEVFAWKEKAPLIGWENLQCDAKQCCSKVPLRQYSLALSGERHMLSLIREKIWTRVACQSYSYIFRSIFRRQSHYKSSYTLNRQLLERSNYAYISRY